MHDRFDAQCTLTSARTNTHSHTRARMHTTQADMELLVKNKESGLYTNSGQVVTVGSS